MFWTKEMYWQISVSEPSVDEKNPLGQNSGTYCEISPWMDCVGNVFDSQNTHKTEYCERERVKEKGQGSKIVWRVMKCVIAWLSCHYWGTRSSEPFLLQNREEDKSLWFRCVNTFCVCVCVCVYVCVSLSLTQTHTRSLYPILLSISVAWGYSFTLR